MPKKLSFVVAGAGGVGPALAAELARYTDPRYVTLADKDEQRIRDATNRPCLEKVSVLGGSIGDVESDVFRDNGMRGEDVVISAVPARFSPALADRAIEHRVNFCDLGGDRRIGQDMHDTLHEKALEAEVSIIPACGLMPGLGNMVGTYLVHRMGGADDVTIYVGGLPQNPLTEAGNYQRTFSLEGLMLILEPALVLKDGDLVEVAPFDELELLDVPALAQFKTGFGGAIEAFTTDGADTAARLMHRLGVKNFREKTVRWPGFVKFIQSIPRDQLLPTLQRILPPTDAAHPDLVWMRVVARKGTRRVSVEILDTYDPVTGFSAMARTTGFSAATVAFMAAQGHTAHGVLQPEEALSPDNIYHCLNLLRRSFDITITEDTVAV